MLLALYWFHGSVPYEFLTGARGRVRIFRPGLGSAGPVESISQPTTITGL